MSLSLASVGLIRLQIYAHCTASVAVKTNSRVAVHPELGTDESHSYLLATQAYSLVLETFLLHFYSLSFFNCCFLCCVDTVR